MRPFLIMTIICGLCAADPTTSQVPAARKDLETAGVAWSTPGLHRVNAWLVSTVLVTGSAGDVDMGAALAQTAAADRLMAAAAAAMWPQGPERLGDLWPAVSARLPLRLSTLDLDPAHEKKPPVVALAINLAQVQAAQVLGGAGDLGAWCRTRLTDPLLAEAALRLADPMDMALRAQLAGSHADAAGRPRLAALSLLKPCTSLSLAAYAEACQKAGDIGEAQQARAVMQALPAAADAWTPWMCGLGLVKPAAGSANLDADTVAFALGEDQHLAPESAQSAADWLRLGQAGPVARSLVCARRAMALGGGLDARAAHAAALQNLSGH